MINTDRIVPVQVIDLVSLYGLILKMDSDNADLAALDATDPGIFEVTSSDGDLLLAAEPVETLDFGEGVSSATVYFVPAHDYAGFTIEGVAATPTGDVNPDGRTLYKAVLGSGSITITQVGF